MIDAALFIRCRSHDMKEAETALALPSHPESIPQVNKINHPSRYPDDFKCSKSLSALFDASKREDPFRSFAYAVRQCPVS
jgi:hypothetical protein